jgi:hypothetical protein
MVKGLDGYALLLSSIKEDHSSGTFPRRRLRSIFLLGLERHVYQLSCKYIVSQMHTGLHSVRKSAAMAKRLRKAC